MIVNLSDVTKGLRAGRSYKRMLDHGLTGTESLTPIGEGMLRHDVNGKNTLLGGWGGSADLPINILNSGRWPDEGWKEVGS